jgi:uncharacterized protein DUF6220
LSTSPSIQPWIMATRHWARVGYVVLICVFVLCVMAQVFLVGLSIFVSPSWWISHRAFGRAFGGLLPLMLVLAIAGGLPRRVLGLTGLLLVLYVLQIALLAMPIPGAATLHPVNAFAIFGVAMTLAHHSMRLVQRR